MIDLLDLTDLPEHAQDQYAHLIQRKLNLNVDEDQLKADKSALSADMVAFLIEHDVKKVEDAILGSLSYVETNRGTINKDKLKEKLLLAGVDVNTIVASIAAATKFSQSTFVKYTKVKK